MAEDRSDETCAAPLRPSLTAQEALVVEDEAGNAAGDRLVRALEALLVERGLLTPKEVSAEIARLQAPGLQLGSRLVARAWTDASFKERLLANGKEAAAELGIKIGEAQLVVVENTQSDHNLIVCTLCSCYPRSLLGQPPSWYISRTYRARAVREPRTVLREFGLDVPDDVRVRVHDSNADMRYMVLPGRPSGTEAWDEAALSQLITRDSLIGIALPKLSGCAEAYEPARS